MKLVPNSCTLCFFFLLLSSPLKGTLAVETQWGEPQGSSLVAREGSRMYLLVWEAQELKGPLTVVLTGNRRLYLRGLFPLLKILKVIFCGCVGIKTNILLHIKAFSFI